MRHDIRSSHCLGSSTSTTPVRSSTVQLVSSTRSPYAVLCSPVCVCHFRRLPHFAKCLVSTQRCVYSNNQDKAKTTFTSFSVDSKILLVPIQSHVCMSSNDVHCCCCTPSRAPYLNGPYCQIRAFMSPDPVAKRCPVGQGATEMTEFLCPCSIIWAFPVLGSQNWTPRSLDPDMTHDPSGVRHTLST